MNDLVARLNDALPPIVNCVTNLQKKTSKESAGPCPVCGGDDRFVVFTDKDRFLCRGCEKSGDKIDFHKMIHGVNSLPKLAEVIGLDMNKKEKIPFARVTPGNMVAEFSYKDEQGQRLYSVRRYEEAGRKKTFRAGVDKGKAWKLGINGVQRVPYNLQLFQTDDDIFIVEGEKCADRLTDFGFLATCFVSSHWQDEYSKYFAGRNVYVLPDNDGPGEIKGKQFAKGTGGKIVTLPGLPHKGDICDWLDNGGTNEGFNNAVDLAESPNDEETITIDDIMRGYEVTKEYVDGLGQEVWLYPNLVISGHILVLIAMTGGGKTTFLFYEVVPHMVRGGAKVYYIDSDSPASEHKEMKAFADKTGFMLINPATRIGKSVKGFTDDLRKMVDSGVDLSGSVFIFDTLKKFTDLMSKSSVKDFFSMCRTMNIRGATCIFSAHANKFRDSDGHLIPEGVGDVKNDTDDLILFERQPMPMGGIEVTSIVDPDCGAKTRGIFKQFSFSITQERDILFSDKVFDVPDFTATRVSLATDDEILAAAEKLLLEIGIPVNKTTLAGYVHDQMEGAGMKRIKRVITTNSKIKTNGATSSRRFSYTIGDRGAQMMEIYRVPVQEDLFQ